MEWYLKRLDEKLHEIDYDAATRASETDSFEEFASATHKIRLRQLTRM